MRTLLSARFASQLPEPRPNRVEPRRTLLTLLKSDPMKVSSKGATGQRSLLFPFGRGGPRPGAGRPKSSRKMPHGVREAFKRVTPIHVTLRVVDGLPSLRRKNVYRRMLHCFEKARTDRFQVVRHSVQGNHLHLIVEANSKAALSRGMQGLGIRLAKQCNRVLRRRGKFFSDRYHARILRSPREVLNALRYLVENGRKHRRQAGFITGPRWRDAYCSLRHDWEPRTWLLSQAPDTG